jgi:hypothetical protein
MTTYVLLREIVCAKSLNIEIVSDIPTMEIKIMESMFYEVFAEISQKKLNGRT